MPEDYPHASSATTALALPVPDPAKLAALPMGDFLTEAKRLAAQSLSLTDAHEGQAKAEAIATKLERQRENEDLQRKAGALACVFAREIGKALPEAKRGRPSKDAPAPLALDLTPNDLQRYRYTAELTEPEFDEWVADARVVSFDALAKRGRALKSERDRETGEPHPPRETTPPPAAAPPAATSGESPQEEGDASPDEETPKEPEPHRLKEFRGLVQVAVEQLAEWGPEWTRYEAELPEPYSIQARELARSLEASHALALSTLPSAPEGGEETQS